MEKKTKAKKLKSPVKSKTTKVEIPDKETTNDPEYIVEIPDGGYGWVVLIASFVCFSSFLLPYFK